MPGRMQQVLTEMTTRPHPPAPQLFCPACQLPLVYRYTVYSGVDHPERWDSLACRTHGMFEYRHRTGKLRADDPS